MGIAFEAPLALLLLIPALLLTGGLYLSARRRVGVGRRRAALVARTLLLTALVFALAGFRLVLPVDRLATVFVVDLSDSVGNDGREAALAFLRETRVIGNEAWCDLSATAQRIAPATVAVGFEYTDPVLKNFVRPDAGGPLCAVDVECLVENRPLGLGIAKASVYWLAPPQRERLLASFDASLPQLRAQLPYVELCFLARWTKTKFLTGKRKHAHGQRFEAFRALR